jgi:alpha-1,2-mannosyltransferase
VTWHAGNQRATPERPPAAAKEPDLRQPGRRQARVPGMVTSPSAGPPSGHGQAPGRGQAPGPGQALQAYWLSPPGRVTLAATGLALAIRLYLLARPGYLTGITEYDDGVYLGGAVSLLAGTVPYHGFAFVQPPGILLLMAPVALLAKVSAVTSAMAVARLLTVAASAACVTLLGSLVRHRGTLVTLVACGVLAIYPDDIMAAHTLLLEPWMNLLVLAGARLAFHDGRLASPRRLLWAGAAFGLAGTVKYWAALPALALLAVCLLAGPGDAPGRRPGGPAGPRLGQAARFAGGALAGFAVPVLPFAAPWPGLFVRSTLLDQVSRAGSAVPAPLRLAHLTGLADLLNDAGKLTLAGNASSLFARGDVTAAATWATGWLPVLLAVMLAALIGLGYAVARARARAGAGPGPLEWYALGTLASTLAAVLAYSAFFYHYADFAAPWLAIAAGYTAGTLLRPRPARRWLAVAATALVVVASVQAWELSRLRAVDVAADAALIPPGACVVSDEISLAIAANRFTAGSGGCPDVLDALAVTLVAGEGVSVQGGAKALPRVAAQWRAYFARARYVWLSGTSDRRIPWTGGLQAWFARNFRPLHPPAGQFSEGQVYVRRG